MKLGVLLQEKCKLVVLAGGICIEKSYKKCSLLVRLSARSLQGLAGFLEEKVLFSCICKNCCKILQEVNKNLLDLQPRFLQDLAGWFLLGLASIHPFTKQMVPSLCPESLTQSLSKSFSPVSHMHPIKWFLPSITFLRGMSFFFIVYFFLGLWELAWTLSFCGECINSGLDYWNGGIVDCIVSFMIFHFWCISSIPCGVYTYTVTCAHTYTI